MINNIGRYSNQQKAVRNFQKREQLRAKIAKYVLLCLLLTLVAAEIKEIVVQLKGHRTMVIAVAKAEVQETSEGKRQDLSSPGEATPPADGIERMILDTFGEDGEDMLAIARCESGLRPDALGDQKLAYTVDGIKYGTSHGIFQVRYLPGRPTPEQLEDPAFNIAYAKQILDRQGKYAWSWCYRHNILKEI